MKKISNKIILLAFLPTLIVGVAVGIMISVITGNSGQSSVYAFENTMRGDFDTVARWETETVVAMLNSIYERQKAGELSLEQAKNLGADIIRDLKYGNNGYFWVDDYNGKNIVSSVRTNEGLNRLEAKDVDGKFFIKDFLLKAKKGGGYSDYRFPKKVGGAPKPKRSYSKAFEPFGWVVGTGNYIDDIDKAVYELQEQQSYYLQMMFLIIIFLVLGAGIVIYISGKRISSPIVEITEKAKLIAKGDLDVIIEQRSNDELGELAVSMQKMVKVLREMILQITQEAGKILSAGKRAAETSVLISKAANELSGSSLQVSSSIEEMSKNINLNSLNANETENISSKVLRDIRMSSKAVKKTESALEAITEKILFINEVASKTDILALNATVQASGAGKYGKGFSVIAHEIKQLANESSIAAARIDSLSSTTIDIAEKSVILLNRLVEDVEKTEEYVTQINQATSKQIEGVQEISNEVNLLNRLSQQNVSIARQTEENSFELAQQADKLIELVSFFRMNT